ncbi:hypothetical protein GCM10027285_20970 [Oleiagrimonas citrea]|uniref:Uncharacterized protein n=1 Tax=Oleiagrimonas citrea TaxID=1665687 RepID=A0A846ZIQ3_9GAMM|nr:hypothetical protein [Oleiagrimonas citrea]NKZ37587.1 hypothetical protein [Oleiagrimonas citrea]
MGKMKKSKGPIGRVKISRTSRGYFHDLNPYSLHATKALARVDRSRLSKMGLGVKSRHPRVSTFYTILQDRRKNHPVKFGNVPQGPHTFPHHGIHHGIVEAKRTGQLETFAPLIPSPDDYGKRVDKEIPSGHGKYDRAKIAKSIFKKRHSRFVKLKNMSPRSEVHSIRFAHVINKLIQMDPLGSYAYKGRGAGKKALKGKGESATKPLAQQIDLPKNSGFSDIGDVQKRNTRILTTLGKFKIK